THHHKAPPQKPITKPVLTQGTSLRQIHNTTVPTTRHITRVKPQLVSLRSPTTITTMSITGHTSTVTHKPQPLAKHESERKRRHHTGTDYWFMTPVSNPDNTTQEVPLSLAVTDERSNCRSTRTSQTTVETN
ncbi:hypothetical protein Taro_016361, partial [Colocasia esculenta]|nr:hypothetical protein [Colocasia esculenta]